MDGACSVGDFAYTETGAGIRKHDFNMSLKQIKKLKIIVAGNSVALRVRPPEEHPGNENYSVLLEKKLQNSLDDRIVLIENRSSGALTIPEALNQADKLINDFPDYYILNFGVVDASSREIPQWYYKRINKKAKSTFEYLLAAVHGNLLKKYRPFFVMIRGKRSWVSTKKFRKCFSTLIGTLVKETNARIIALPINPANNRVEQELPGSRDKQLIYNRIIQEACNKYKQIFLDTTDFIEERHYPDGVHYSAVGHELLAEKLKDIILKDRKPSSSRAISREN